MWVGHFCLHCVPSGFSCSANEIFNLLGCFAVSVGSYRWCFRTACRSHHQPVKKISLWWFPWLLKVVPIGFPETSVTSYWSALRTNPGRVSSLFFIVYSEGSCSYISANYCLCAWSVTSYNHLFSCMTAIHTDSLSQHPNIIHVYGHARSVFTYYGSTSANVISFLEMRVRWIYRSPVSVAGVFPISAVVTNVSVAGVFPISVVTHCFSSWGLSYFCGGDPQFQ